MNPIRTERSNFTFLGSEREKIGDLPCRRDLDGGIYSTWELTPEERIAIAEGANIELGVWTYGRGFPPVSLIIDSTPIALLTKEEIEEQVRLFGTEPEYET